MTALDLGDASRSLVIPDGSATSAAFGDIDLDYTTGGSPAAIPVASSVYGDYIDLATIAANDAPYIGGSGIALGVDHVLIVALTGPVGDPYGGVDVFIEGLDGSSADTAVGIELSGTDDAYWTVSDVGDFETLTTPHDDRLVVVGIAGGASASTLATSRDGVVATSGPATAIATGTQLFVGSYGSTLSTAGIVGMWLFESAPVSDTDLVDTVSAVAAGLSPLAASATGAWGITAPTATVTVGMLSDPEDAPDLDAGGAVTPPTPPTPPTPEELEPFGIVPVRHVWERMPTPTLDASGNPVDWEAEASGDAAFGTLRYVFEGTDVTVIDGIMTPQPQWTRGRPFGPQGAIFEFTQLSGLEAWPAWVRGGANVSIQLVKMNGDVLSLWEGVAVAPQDSQPGAHPTVECVGALMASNLQRRLPSPRTAPKDVGLYIPEVLNAVPSKRHATIAKMVTGIRTSVVGGWEDVLDWVQRVLSTAVRGGRQLTLDCDERTPVLRWKDLDSIDFEVHFQQRNIAVNLGLDYAGAANVYYGTGVNPRGGRWSNMVYPGFHDDTTPDYPFDPPSQSIRVGTRDSGTTTGNGVSLVQAKLGRPVTGQFNEGDRRETIRRQRRGGILDDGIVGPQTWAMLFQVGANSGTLAGAFPMPLAANPKVMPRLLGPDGDDLGPNPAYDPTILRVVDVIESGQNVEKADAVDDAEGRLAVFGKPAYAGTIVFNGIDPEQMPRLLIREGMNGRVNGVHGRDVQLHVGRVTQEAGTTTLEVDERGRDYPTLQALLERDRSATDPAKLARQKLLRGDIAAARAEYDAESPGGRIVKHAVYGGLWTIARVPMGDYGDIVRTVVTTSSAPTLFSFAVFGKQVTANQLVARVGNPLTAVEDPWDDDTLDTDLGLLNAWGWTEQKMGTYPKQFSNPGGTTGAPVTGRLVDDLAWEYATENGQDLWVATFAASSCFVEGRFYGRSS